MEFVPIPSHPEFDPNEIQWFNNFRAGILVFRGNGMLQYASGQQTTPQSLFLVTDYVYPTSHLSVMETKNPILTHVRSAFTGYIIDVYSIDQGTRINRFDLCYLPSARISDVKSDPNRMTLLLASDTAVYTISLESGMVVSQTQWVYEGPVEGVYVNSDTQTHVVFYENHLIGRDTTGNVLWNKPIDMNSVYIEPFCCTNAYKPCIIFLDTDGREDQFECLDARTGVIIWAHSGGYQALRGLSQDGLRQAWFRSGQMTITNLPSQHEVSVSTIQDMPDVIFSSTSKIAYCLPALTAGKENTKSKTYPLFRKTQKLQVIDSTSGNLIREVDLTQGK
jgi:hypothetical protein